MTTEFFFPISSVLMNCIVLLALLFNYLNNFALAIDLIEKAQILGYPQITCSPKWITVWFETSIPFQGRVYVEGHPYDTRCSTTYLSNLDNNATFRFPIVPCSTYINNQSVESNLYATANIRVSFHPYFITNNSRIIKVDCEDPALESNNTTPKAHEENTICHHLVLRKKSSLKTYLTIGETIYHRWTCPLKYDISNYAILLRNCDVSSPMKETVHLVDENGCIVDEYLFDEFNYSNNSLSITAVSRAFKFVDQTELRFTCQVVLIQRKHKQEHVKFPKCTISRQDLESKNPSDSLYLDFATIFNDTKMIETKTVTEWITVLDDPKMLETLEDTEMKVTAKVNDTINENSIQLEKIIKQDSISEFYPNSVPYYKGHIPTMDEMLARLHHKPTIGRKAIQVDQNFTNLQLLNESSMEISLTSVNQANNSIMEEEKPDVDDDLLNISGLSNMEYFETDEDSLEKISSSTEKVKYMRGSRVETEKGNESQEDGFNNSIIMPLLEKSTTNKAQKFRPIITTVPYPTPRTTTPENEFMTTKLFKSILTGFVPENQIVQSDEIDLNSFRTYKKSQDPRIDFNLDPNRSTSDCNDNRSPLGSEETRSSKFCTWRHVNILLFIFTLCSLIIWLVMIGIKIHKCFWKNAELERARRRIQTAWVCGEDFDSFAGWYSRVGTPKPPRYSDR